MPKFFSFVHLFCASIDKIVKLLVTFSTLLVHFSYFSSTNALFVSAISRARRSMLETEVCDSVPCRFMVEKMRHVFDVWVSLTWANFNSNTTDLVFYVLLVWYAHAYFRNDRDAEGVQELMTFLVVLLVFKMSGAVASKCHWIYVSMKNAAYLSCHQVVLIFKCKGKQSWVSATIFNHLIGLFKCFRHRCDINM